MQLAILPSTCSDYAALHWSSMIGTAAGFHSYYAASDNIKFGKKRRQIVTLDDLANNHIFIVGQMCPKF